MILDDYNSNLYLENKIIHLTESENRLIAFFIKNKNKILSIKDLCEGISYSASVIYSIMRKINKKIYPYAEICNKYKKGYLLIIKSSKKFILWKKIFLKEHNKTFELLKLYKQKEILEKKIKILEKNII